MRTALSAADRLAVYDRHTAGESLADIAGAMGIHYETARKWWREGRRHGRERLAKRPRKPVAKLRKVAPEVTELILKLRADHGNWGLPYLRQQVLADTSVSAEQRATVPGLSSFYRYLRDIEQRAPKVKLHNQVPTETLIKQAEHPHHLWQMDLKEKCRVDGLPNQLSVVNVRDVYSSVTIGAVVFELSRPYASLSGADMQAACRACFSDWGLPTILRTDYGSCFLGNMPQTGYPSPFILWLRGLDIVHEKLPKGKVTQNGCVERFNRTYRDLVLNDGPFTNLAEVQALSATTVEFLNTTYPSRAGSCANRAPLSAHPQAKTPKRPYQPETELSLFDITRVYDYLAAFRWQRCSDSVGKASLGGYDYYLGRENRRLVCDVTFDKESASFRFTTPDGEFSALQPACGIDAQALMHITSGTHKSVRKGEKA